MKKQILLFILSIAIVSGVWAGATKMGYIPNVTGLELLCSGEKNSNNETQTYQNNFENTDSNSSTHGVRAKPVIYLYPEKKEKIKVQLEYKGKLTATYPDYDKKIKGWEVEAYSDGKVIDLKDGKEYSYLFWEGVPREKTDWDLNKGFIVKGEDVREFLREKLKYMGLTPKEYNEFIVYWYPKMMDNKYNLVHFATKKYTDTAPLKISPKPDSMLRVFMVFKPLDKKIDIEE